MPAIFCRSITSPVRQGSCYRPSSLICPSVSLSGSGVECVGPSVRAESRYGNLCPAHAQPGSSPLYLVSSPSPFRLPDERTRGQHRNQRGRWITSVEQECGAQTMPKPRSQRRFYGERQTCVVFATCGKIQDNCHEIQETRRRRSHVKNSQEGRD